MLSIDLLGLSPSHSHLIVARLSIFPVRQGPLHSSTRELVSVVTVNSPAYGEFMCVSPALMGTPTIKRSPHILFLANAVGPITITDVVFTHWTLHMDQTYPIGIA